MTQNARPPGGGPGVSLDAVTAQAERGDGAAQYALAAFYSSRNEAERADQWLQRAAQSGVPDALYTLATRDLQTGEGAREAARKLEAATEAGSSIAMRLLGVLYAEGFGVSTSWAKAVSLVVAATTSGDVGAVREIAMLLLLQPENEATGLRLMAHAAQTDAVAAAVFARLGAEGRVSIELARAALAPLAKAGYPHAPALQNMLADAAGQRGEGAPAAGPDLSGASDPDWQAIEASLANGLPDNQYAYEIICASPDARCFRGAFTGAEAEYVIATSARRLAPSLTVDPRTGASRRDAYRTSLTATMGPVDLDLALVAINRRLSALAGRPPENGEFLSVLHYAEGQEYKPHFDWLPPGEDLARGGQRISTALFYLNDDYEGGETWFLTPDVKFRGATGDVLIFHNVSADGVPDKASRHASLPVTEGAKWLCSKWFRAEKYAF
ncbi:MAG: 2OG-Fe(II) oxygenase [Pseudomonadota bacterium]